MTELLLWAAIAAGVIVSVVQLVTARRLDLEPLILGALALVVALGLLDVASESAAVLGLLAQGSAPDIVAHLAQHLGRAIRGITVLAYGVGGISVVGGVAIFLHDVRGQRAEPAPASDAPANPATAA